jgi:hypothetical protein
MTKEKLAAHLRVIIAHALALGIPKSFIMSVVNDSLTVKVAA